MTNWSSFASCGGARVTTWNYDSYRGWLASKQYDDGQGPSYTYTFAGRLQQRTWARTVNSQALTTTYGYDLAGALLTVTYSDSTPGVTYTYGRLGRMATATVGTTSTASLTYNLAGEQLSESYSGGTLDGLSVASTYDTFLRRTDLSAQYSSTSLLHHSFGFDAASRLQTVTDNTGTPAYSATYSYLANSPLVSQITYKQGTTTTRMTTTKQYDNLNRLLSVSSAPSASSAVNFSYSYNSANQRVNVTLADGSYWVYTYDNLGQVISGKKYWPDNSAVAGQQFGYAFDDIGNRETTAAGGDNGGQNLRSASYSANNLNQYTQRTVLGYVSSLGSASANATVTLWSSGGSYAPSLRKGTYFRAELPVNNNNGALWLTLTNLAVMNNGSNPDIVATTLGHEFLPQTPEQFAYDLDGNLTSDGHWSYTWDAENRLVQLTPSTTVGPQISLKFEYDCKGRRIRKQVWPDATWTGTPTNDVKFLYDGWNLLAELDALNASTLLRSYVWGLDLSGTIQGAGGIGGLLFIRNLPSAICYSPAFDGNGNVSALASMADGTIAAQYEYGPFGEVIRATGPMAKANPFRFSTKYQDDESDLLYYGYRYYNASTGRWLSRDPVANTSFPVMNIETWEIYFSAVLSREGDTTSYAFVRNEALSHSDQLGLNSYGPGGDVHYSPIEHNNYIEYSIACPPTKRAANIKPDYTGVAACLANAFHVPPGMQASFIDFWNKKGLGGLRGISGINCDGDPVTVQAYMRSRFTGLPWFTAGRNCYNDHVTIKYDCKSCLYCNK